MAVNLATKYSDKIATAFTHASYVKGNTSSAYDFTGVKTLKIYTPTTVPEVDYTRDGANRYGAPVEMQDTVQEMKMTQDKAFSLTIDKGNNLDQMNVKGAGRMLRLQLQERTTPAADKYALQQYVKLAGTVMGISAKPTKSNVVSTIFDMGQAMDDAQVPEEDRYLYMTAEMYKLVCISDEFTKLDGLGSKSIPRGVCGSIDNFTIVKVPAGYLPESCFMLACYKGSVLFPYKIQDTKIHEDPMGVSGNVLEGRHYYDAFVLGAKCMGVVACVLSSQQQAAPTVTISSHSVTPTSSGAAKILYTLDGSDPRYSDSAEVVTGAVTTTAGQTIKAVAFGADGKFTSDVAEDTDEG